MSDYLGSVRRRGEHQFRVGATSMDRAGLDMLALQHAQSFVIFEAQGVRLATGHLVGPRWVLWEVAPQPVVELEFTAPLLAPPRRPKTTRHKGITRVDVEGGIRPNGTRRRASHGYMARVVWQGHRYIKWFSDRRHGDRLGALTAALDWRDAQERSLGKPRTNLPVVGKANTNTGLVGIREQRSGPRGLREFEVTWRTLDGRTRRTSYSIAKHGRHGALARAKAKRRHEEAARIGGNTR